MDLDLAIVSNALACDAIRSRQLTGGDFAAAHRVELSDGRVVFAKTHGDPPDGFFTTEATGLEWLRQADALNVPEVLHVSDSPPLLVLTWIEESQSARPDEAGFGRSLASLHLAGTGSFGRADSRPTGSQALPNATCGTWAQFLAEQRLEPLARIAAERQSLSSSVIGRIEQVAHKVAELLGPPEPAARLHGDLWAGNRLVDPSGESWLVDPACFGGHREFDLAMMRLFGGFGRDVFAAYHDVSPLADGWADRIALHQLPPLIVHAIKFGGSYVGAVEQAVGRYT